MHIPNKAFTHAGKFHADDVFSAALLRYFNPEIRIERGFQVPPGYDGLVFDIGDGEFDHHARNSPVRENGVPYAAFGLLWRELTKVLYSRSTKTITRAAAIKLQALLRRTIRFGMHSRTKTSALSKP